MYAVEFQAIVRDGIIEIPEEYREQLNGHIRVILLTEEKDSQPNFIAQLLEHPRKVKDFTPLTREEIYER